MMIRDLNILHPQLVSCSCCLKYFAPPKETQAEFLLEVGMKYKGADYNTLWRLIDR